MESKYELFFLYIYIRTAAGWLAGIVEYAIALETETLHPNTM